MIIFLAFSGPAPGSSANLSVLSLNACINPLDLESVTLMSKSPLLEVMCITDPDTVADKLAHTPEPNMLPKFSDIVAPPKAVPAFNPNAILSVAILPSLLA